MTRAPSGPTVAALGEASTQATRGRDLSEGIPKSSRGDVGGTGAHTMCGPVAPVFHARFGLCRVALHFTRIVSAAAGRISLSDVMPLKNPGG